MKKFILLIFLSVLIIPKVQSNTCELILQVKPVPKYIYFVTVNYKGKVNNFMVNLGTTVEELKRMLRYEHGASIALDLYFENVLMKDDKKTLASYGVVKDGDYINVEDRIYVLK